MQTSFNYITFVALGARMNGQIHATSTGLLSVQFCLRSRRSRFAGQPLADANSLATSRARLPNALVQLQARYNHCGAAASEKCLSAATFVRQLVAKRNLGKALAAQRSALRAGRAKPYVWPGSTQRSSISGRVSFPPRGAQSTRGYVSLASHVASRYESRLRSRADCAQKVDDVAIRLRADASTLYRLNPIADNAAGGKANAPAFVRLAQRNRGSPAIPPFTRFGRILRTICRHSLGALP